MASTPVMPARALAWRVSTGHVMDLGRPRVMGIINVTPDSFSDGGAHAACDAAVAWGRTLLDQGADILDVGGESTRPGFTAVPDEEEIARVVPVIRELAGIGAVVSVDTRHPAVARAALDAGASIINDVSGFEEPAMVELAVRTGCGCVVMHSGGHLRGGCVQGDQDVDAYVDGVITYLRDAAERLVAAGVDPAVICLDPGPGFGTTPVIDVAVQRRLPELVALGFPVMVAISRKRFVGKLTGTACSLDRDAASAMLAVDAIDQGARIVRAHDVAGLATALAAHGALRGSAPERQALIALGSNMGERLDNLQSALDRIAALPCTRVDAVSRAWGSEPAYDTDQEAFVNSVALVSTRLHPMALLGDLLMIEDEMGRVRVRSMGPRVIDLDLLWMDGETHAGARLTLPHPLIGERAFVLDPLTDVIEDVEAALAAHGITALPVSERLGATTGPLDGLVLPR